MTYTALAVLKIIGDDLSAVDSDAIVKSLRYLQRQNGRSAITITITIPITITISITFSTNSPSISFIQCCVALRQCITVMRLILVSYSARMELAISHHHHQSSIAIAISTSTIDVQSRSF